jgi:orotate phosphoribosyltransferase
MNATSNDPQPLQTLDERLAELRADIVAAAWRTGDQLVDADLFLTKPTILRRLAAILADRVPPDTDRLVSREPNAAVLGAALALATGLPLVVAHQSPSVPALHCEGELHPGERALVVESVVDTGGSAEQAVRALLRRSAEVVGVLAAVDCEAGAAERLQRYGAGLDSLFLASQLRAVATRTRRAER